MSDKDRLPLFPSRANEVYMKQRIVMANKGLTLLKRKRDAIEIKIREVNTELRSYTELVEKHMVEALIAISKAKYLCTDFKPAQVMKADCCNIYMILDYDKVAGLKLPKFDLIMNHPTCFPFTGLSHGGTQVEYIRVKFRDAIKAIVSRASLEFTLNILQNGLKLNNMRLNGLDFVVIPRFVNTMHYIHDELDEFEREEFYRLKQSKAKQLKRRENFTKVVHTKNEDIHGKSNINKFKYKAFKISPDDQLQPQTTPLPHQASSNRKQKHFDPPNEPPQKGPTETKPVSEKSAFENIQLEKESTGKWFLKYPDPIKEVDTQDEELSQLQYQTENPDDNAFYEIDSDDELLSVERHTYKRLSEKEINLIRENYRKSSGPYVRDSRVITKAEPTSQISIIHHQRRKIHDESVHFPGDISQSDQLNARRDLVNQKSENVWRSEGNQRMGQQLQGDQKNATKQYEGALHIAGHYRNGSHFEEASHNLGTQRSKSSIRFQVDQEHSADQNDNEPQANINKKKIEPKL